MAKFGWQDGEGREWLSRWTLIILLNNNLFNASAEIERKIWLRCGFPLTLFVEKLGIFIEVTDISACHRLGKFQRNSRFPRRVIVKFINRKIVYGALNNREKLWDLRGDLQMNLRFYESLCSLNQEALRICKGLQEEGLIHSYYIWHGFVNIVVKDGDKPFKIKHPEVLREKFNQTPE